MASRVRGKDSWYTWKMRRGDRGTGNSWMCSFPGMPSLKKKQQHCENLETLPITGIHQNIFGTSWNNYNNVKGRTTPNITEYINKKIRQVSKH